jgi:YVTN family beta-propeller protein
LRRTQVTIIDPESNRVVDSVSNVGGRPWSIMVEEGAVWVADRGGRCDLAALKLARPEGAAAGGQGESVTCESRNSE